MVDYIEVLPSESPGRTTIDMSRIRFEWKYEGIGAVLAGMQEKGESTVSSLCGHRLSKRVRRLREPAEPVSRSLVGERSDRSLRSRSCSPERSSEGTVSILPGGPCPIRPSSPGTLKRGAVKPDVGPYWLDHVDWEITPWSSQTGSHP